MSLADQHKEKRAITGYQLQDACNFIAVAHTLMEMLAEIRQDAGRDYYSDLPRSDPGVILCVAKLTDMCNITTLGATIGPAFQFARQAMERIEKE